MYPSPVERRDAHLMHRALNGHIPDIHVHDVRFNAALNHGIRQHDAFGSEDLHQGFGNDAAAVIASGRAAVLERAGLEDVDLDVEVYGLGHFEQEVREKRARRPAPDDGDSRTILQGQSTLFRVGQIGKRVQYRGFRR
jgi:hypothetical protein